MTNILVVVDHWDATRFASDHWATARWFFGPNHKFLKAIATMAVVQPNPDEGESRNETLVETAYDIIGYRCDDQDEEHPAPDLTEDQRESVVQYLLECHAAIRPYLPSGGTMQLRSYVTSTEFKELYLIIKHHDDREYPDQTGPGAGIRAITTSD